jgi:hypothetical protein
MSYTVARDGQRPCITCERVLPLASFYSYPYTTRQGKPSVRTESRCMECARARRMDRYAAKGESERATSLAWKRANKAHLAAYGRKKQQDPTHRALKAKAQRMRKARMRAGSTANDPAIRAIYQEAMDWEQKLALCVASDDPLDLCVHVDHVTPLSKGGLHVASNLQVTSAYFNLRKGARHA